MATGTLQVVDYSFSRIDHGLAKAYGVVGCMRYLYGNGKGLTADEVALFRSSGLALGLNYEAGAGDFVGYAAGVTQAISAKRFADQLGLSGHTIIFSADFDVPSGQFSDIAAAINGALSILGDGNVGIYGHADLIDAMHGTFGDRIYYWQTYAWSGGRRSAHADLYQFRNGQDMAGGQVDFNEITGRTFWAIGTNGHTTAGGTATPIEEDTFMGYLDKKPDGSDSDERAAIRADMLDQANKAVKPVYTALMALTKAVQTGRADFGDFANDLKNAGLIDKD